MKKLALQAAIRTTLSYLFISLIIGIAFGAENHHHSDRLGNPFLLPQTSFVIGNSHHLFDLSGPFASSRSNLNSNDLNTYGFDLEINYSRFMNIGAYFRFESQSVDRSREQNINKHFSTLLGGFTRFFYSPSFLNSNIFKSNVFTRFELGGGPTILGGPSGVLGQTGLSIGAETYINKWIGLSLSYGQVFEYGKESIINGDDSISNSVFGVQYKDASIWSRGRVLLFALKTTFL